MDKDVQDIKVEDLISGTHILAKSETEASRSYVIKIFKIFDQDLDDTIDIEDFGNVLRALGLFVNETQITQLLQELPQTSGRVTLDVFLPTVLSILSNGEYKMPNILKLYEAFGAIDFEKSGSIPLDKMREFLTNHGEVLSENEYQVFQSACKQHDLVQENQIKYHDVVDKLFSGIENDVLNQKQS